MIRGMGKFLAQILERQRDAPRDRVVGRVIATLTPPYVAIEFRWVHQHLSNITKRIYAILREKQALTIPDVVDYECKITPAFGEDLEQQRAIYRNIWHFSNKELFLITPVARQCSDHTLDIANILAYAGYQCPESLSTTAAK